eukprot:jgi/Botrbrau1/13167/Bobra.242_1s0004.2
MWRKHALTLACQQEAALYEQCTGRPSYQNLAARTRASLPQEEGSEAPEDDELESSSENLFSSSREGSPEASSADGTCGTGPVPAESAREESPAAVAMGRGPAAEVLGESTGDCGTGGTPGPADSMQQDLIARVSSGEDRLSSVSGASEGGSEGEGEDPAVVSRVNPSCEGPAFGESGTASASAVRSGTVDPPALGPGGADACPAEVQANRRAPEAGSVGLREDTGKSPAPLNDGLAQPDSAEPDLAELGSAEPDPAKPGLAEPDLESHGEAVQDAGSGMVVVEQDGAEGGGGLGRRCASGELGSAPVKRRRTQLLGRRRSSQQDEATQSGDGFSQGLEEAGRMQECHDAFSGVICVPPKNPSLGSCVPADLSMGSRIPEQPSVGAAVPLLPEQCAGTCVEPLPEGRSPSGATGGTETRKRHSSQAEFFQDDEVGRKDGKEGSGSSRRKKVACGEGTFGTSNLVPPPPHGSADGAVQLSTASCVPPPPPCDPPMASHQRTKDAVLGYVRGILDPMYAAKAISKEIYKTVAKKAVDKVMKSHAGAEDASFLLREGFHVQVLVQKYVEYFKARPPASAPQ